MSVEGLRYLFIALLVIPFGVLYDIVPWAVVTLY